MKKSMKKRLIGGSIKVGLLLAMSCGAWAETPQIPPILDETAIKNGQGGRVSVDPCENFYEYACGAWIDRTTIPSDKSAVSRQVTAASDATSGTLNKILSNYARGDFSIPSRYAKKLSDFYNSCMNVEKSAAVSTKAIQKQIQLIRKTPAGKPRAKLLADLKMRGTTLLFGFGSIQDPNNSAKVIAAIQQDGMGFESKSYYLDQDAKATETRAKYKEYLAKLLTLAGEKAGQADQIAARVLEFETKLAQNAFSLEDRYNPEKTNNPANLTKLRQLAPHFDWKTYLDTLGLKAWDDFSIEVPPYLTSADQLASVMKPREFADYVVARLLDSVAPYMGGAFEKAHFEFWNMYMAGAKTMQPRWKVCTDAAAKFMGYPLAEAYVSTFDGAPIRRKTEEMIQQIKSSFLENLKDLSKGSDAWIDDATVSGAVEKVGKVTQKLGAPDKYRDFDSVQTSDSRYLENILRLAKHESDRDRAKIGQPVDRTEWQMMPWEVNAYYDRSMNEFVFPFGILQPPSLDLKATDGANFGSFGGGTIGHELLHGFDKNGAKYDADGNLKDWWSKGTGEQFEKRAQCFIDQANQYRMKQVGLNINGAQTIDENLADQGGVKLGYLALDRILAGRPEVQWQGYGERQQFWLGYAQSWCNKMTTEQMRKRILTDPHPAAEFRVNGVMMNRPEFARDFSCKSGTKMAPVHRCAIW